MAVSIHDLDLHGVSDAIGRREISSEQATEAYLGRIAEHDSVLRAYITVTADMALAQAKEADAEIARGRRRGPLHGVPMALKDLIAVAGVKMTSAPRVPADHVPTRVAFITRRLKDAGAVLLGKLAMHEFAFGRPVTEGAFPTGRNPWDVRRAPAGSSSGSAVATAAGLCAGALGSDTGGSIRGPAAMTGLVGHKPTYGLVSRSGVLPLSWSLDHVGPMTRGVWDSAVLLQAIAGADPDDTSTRGATVQDYVGRLEDGARGLRLGLLKRYYVDGPGLNDEVRAAALTAFDVLRKEGATIDDVDAPSLDLAMAAWAPIMSEAYEYHADTLRATPEKYGEGLRTRIYLTALFTAQDVQRAQRLRARIGREVDALLSRVDALIFPGQAAPALRFEEFPSTGFAPARSATPRRGICWDCPRWSCRRDSRARGCRYRSRSSAVASTMRRCCASRAPTSASPTGIAGARIRHAGVCD